MVLIVAAVGGVLWGVSRPGLLVRWPDGHVKLYNASQWPVSVARGVAIWNGSGANVRFELVSTRADADIVIDGEPERNGRCSPTARGCATIGYVQAPWIGRYMALRRREPTERDVGQMIPTVAHELGHVLGLMHNDHECSLMNSSSPCRDVDVIHTGDCGSPHLPALVRRWCRRYAGERTLCGPTDKDLREIIDLYGGAVNPHREIRCTVSGPSPLSSGEDHVHG